jgi:nitrate/nitrite transporter NarK
MTRASVYKEYKRLPHGTIREVAVTTLILGTMWTVGGVVVQLHPNYSYCTQGKVTLCLTTLATETVLLILQVPN